MPALAHRFVRAVLLLLLLPLLLLACQSREEREGEGENGAKKRAQLHRISIEGFEFVPSRLQVEAGDTILWVNRDITPHTATAADNSWDTGSIESGDSALLVLSEEKNGAYICAFHPSMKAILETNTSAP